MDNKNKKRWRKLIFVFFIISLGTIAYFSLPIIQVAGRVKAEISNIEKVKMAITKFDSLADIRSTMTYYKKYKDGSMKSNFGGRVSLQKVENNFMLTYTSVPSKECESFLENSEEKHVTVNNVLLSNTSTAIDLCSKKKENSIVFFIR